jgi:hypothetical protein
MTVYPAALDAYAVDGNTGVPMILGDVSIIYTGICQPCWRRPGVDGDGTDAAVK